MASHSGRDTCRLQNPLVPTLVSCICCVRHGLKVCVLRRKKTRVVKQITGRLAHETPLTPPQKPTTEFE